MSSDSEVKEASSHAATLKKLKYKDSDFYGFLEEHDQEILNFPYSEESEDEEQEIANEEESDIEILPKTLAYIKKNINSSPTPTLCKILISTFKSAVNQADGSNKKINMCNSEFFNDVVKLCLIDLVPALYKLMHLNPEAVKKKIDPTRSKQWKTVQMSVKSYLIDMLKMISLMKESSGLVLLLKHTVHLIPFYNVFIKLSRQLLKKMVTLWSSEEETIRVPSLIIIVRCAKSLPKEYMGQVLKEMYFAYIINTKFTSPSKWPMINFMKRSLTEVYALNPEIAYEHGFIYIRQMSTHLRNAIMTKKKEAFQTVYTWQYIHCILLWSHLLCILVDHEPLKSLIYPLVQTTIGTINLIPTAKYIPLRFHLVKALINISSSTGIFVPVLPFILDVLKMVDYNKKSNFSVKPVDFSCALKVTESQLLEAGFKDACISEVCSLQVEYLKSYASSIGFPELALPAELQTESFIKQCKVSKYNQQLRAVLLKTEENSLLISEKRRLVPFSITDSDHVKRWEENIRLEGTPLSQMKKEVMKRPVVVIEDMPPKKKRKEAK